MIAATNLLGLLASQQEVFQRLRDLLYEERACLMQSKLDDLQAIVDEQTALLASQSLLSARISETLTELGIELHVAGQSSLAQLIEHLTSPISAQLEDYFHNLIILADELQREGKINWRLYQQALHYIDFTLKLVAQSQEGPRPYTVDSPAGARGACHLLVDSCA